MNLLLPALLIWVVLSLFSSQSAHAQQGAPAAGTSAQSSEATPEQKPDAAASEPKKKDDDAAHNPHSFGGELAKETRESTGEEEEHADLKHAASVQWLGRKLGLDVHQAHMAALIFNFAVVAAVILWAGFKFLPGVFRNRTAGIQQALEEARAASVDANRRLADIENRLQQLGVEVGQMTAKCGEGSRSRGSADSESGRGRCAQGGAGCGAGNCDGGEAGAARIERPYGEPCDRARHAANQSGFQYRPGAGAQLCLDARVRQR